MNKKTYSKTDSIHMTMQLLTQNNELNTQGAYMHRRMNMNRTGNR